MIAWLVVTLVLGLDQLSKQWALTALGKVGSTVVLPGPIDLTLVFNYSNSFGLVPVSGELTRWGLTVLNLAIASILVAVVLRHATARLSTIAFAFIAAGAIGNALDRIRFGAVVDLFDASKLGFIWIFNVAEISIDIGIALLLLAALPRNSRCYHPFSSRSVDIPYNDGPYLKVGCHPAGQRPYFFRTAATAPD